jgi:PAS domain S-box-containing protein
VVIGSPGGDQAAMSDEGSWELDLHSWTLLCSESCKAVFGRGPAQAFSYVDMLATVHPDDRPRMQVAIQHSVQTGGDLAIDYRNTWPDGSIHWVAVRARIARDQAGRASRLVGVASDITGSKTAEGSRRPVKAPGGSRPAGRSTILVVDDDALVATITTDMLEDMGHDVLATHSGAEALAVLRDERRVDLMITDVSMPIMTGLQLARAARHLRPDLPILLVTGYAELPSEETMSLPRLGKPYTGSQLAAEIAKLLTPSAPII